VNGTAYTFFLLGTRVHFTNQIHLPSQDVRRASDLHEDAFVASVDYVQVDLDTFLEAEL
jgi:hypothetical protein